MRLQPTGAFGVLAWVFLLAHMLSPPAVRAQEATDYAAHFNHGSELLQQTYFHDAVAEFREAIRLNANYLPAHQALVIAYALAHCFDLAWQEVAIVRGAGAVVDEKLLRLLGEEISEEDATAKRATTAQELADARSAVAEQGRNAAVHARLGHALANSGDFPAAQMEAALALQINPAEPEAHFVLATILITDPPTDQQGLPHVKIYLKNVRRTAATLPDAVAAYTLLADYYRHQVLEHEELVALQEGLQAGPENFHLLNSIAWLYATATDPSIRDPKNAVAFAQKAVAVTQERKPSILDTLGESYYSNGDVDDAIATEKKAIALAPDNDFLKDQLKKFQNSKQKAASPKP